MKMPAKMKAKWLKALRSGEYSQTKGTLYNPVTCGFCCLGVLQHTVSKGSVETDEEDMYCNYAKEPSIKWYEDNGIKIYGTDLAEYPDDPDLTKLIDMNDGKINPFTGKRQRSKPFSFIANWIEKNVETY